MKKKLLIKKIKALGATFIRQGGSHEVWRSKNGKPFMVPRHTEVEEWTAKGIIKDAKGE